MRNSYEFRSRWTAPATAEKVWAATESLLASADPFPWWPSVRVLSNDGAALQLEARSVFGYALRFRLYDLVREPSGRLAFSSDGDLLGHGMMVLTPADVRSSIVDIQWNVSPSRAWMKTTSWLLRPLFILAHDVLMRQGEKNFNRWLTSSGRT